MNLLWFGMIAIAVVYAAFTGNLKDVTQAAVDSSKDAISLCITMMGIMSFWVGIMKIAQRSGLIWQISRKMTPILHFLFPNIKDAKVANEYIATNIVANIFGLGWAATPAGLKAMGELDKLNTRENGKQGRASDEMCTFLVLNISSLQLIPVNMIAYRSQYGSANPTAIVGPAIIATFISTAVAVIFCKIMGKGKKKCG